MIYQELLVVVGLLSMTGGHGSNKSGNPDDGTLEVDGVDGVRQGARTVLKEGVRNVKLMATGGVASPGETPFGCSIIRRRNACCRR